MKKILERFVQTLLFAAALTLVYFTYVQNYGRQLELYLILYVVGLCYHLFFDQQKSRLFIIVFSMFIISAAIGVAFFYVKERPRPQSYIFASNVFAFLGFLFIFLKMFKEYPPRFVINKWSILVGGILLLNAFFGVEIFQLVQRYHLSWGHFFFGFVYTIFKMLLLSVGLIFYLTSKNRSRKLSLLIGSFICFFLSDIIDTANSLFYAKDPIPAADILFSGLFCIALCFFYMYCTSPLVTEVLEKESFI